MAGEGDKGGGKGLGGLLSGFTDLLGRLEELAESGEALSRSGRFDLGGERPGAREGGEPSEQESPPPQEGRTRKPMKGVYGFSVKVGLGGGGGGGSGSDFKVEPFGNIRTDEQTGESVVEEEREPLLDVFDEGPCLLIVAEMPGVEAGDLRIDLDDRALTLSAERGDKKYRKTLEVPAGLSKDRMDVSCKNGIIEISCAKTTS